QLMSNQHRQDRINELLFEELSQLVQFELTDPAVQDCRVTRVVASRDLATARVFFSIIGSEEPDAKYIEECRKGLVRAAHYLKKELARGVNLRRTPDLVFNYDGSARVLELMESIEIPEAPPEAIEPEQAREEHVANIVEIGASRQ